MIHSADLAAISAEDYTQPADIGTDGLHVRFTRVADELVVSCRGSEDVADWWQNFTPSECVSTSHPQIGKVAAAFALPLFAEYGRIRARLSEHPLGASPTIIGHSRGGAQAQHLAGLLKSDGFLPAQLVTFGSPRGGSAELAILLADMPGDDYHNGNDPVVYVPFFKRPRPLTPIGSRGFLRLDIRDHFIAAYQASLLALST